MHLFPTTTIYSFLFSTVGFSIWEHMCVCVTSSMLGKMTQRVMLAESILTAPHPIKNLQKLDYDVIE